MTEWVTHQIFCVLDVKNKRVSNLIYILLKAFENLSRLLISSDLTINLKYTFNIPFRITLKTIIMGISSQFHDGAQLKFYPHLAQRYYALLDWAQETFAKAWSSLLNNNGKLMCNSTNFLRLNLSQYGKAFRLSTPVTY